jgi:hypothetical protein
VWVLSPIPCPFFEDENPLSEFSAGTVAKSAAEHLMDLRRVRLAKSVPILWEGEV